MEGWSLFTCNSREVDVLGAGVGIVFDEPDDPEDEGVTTILDVDTL